MTVFEQIAQKDKLSIGLVFPLESYKGAVPSMRHQEKLAGRAEALGYKALWFRDVPFLDPSFGDVGQLYDPWIYMTHIMNHTNKIALATGSIILPLRHPVHVLKSINSLQILSGKRIVMGIASGDRQLEYPAFGRDLDERSELFRDSYFYIRALQGEFPKYSSEYYGEVTGGLDLVPKYNDHTPMIVTGHSGQSLEWIAEHSNGWIYYPRDFKTLDIIMSRWQQALSQMQQDWKPFIQSLYVDLVEDENAAPKPIHLGFQCGINYLIYHLKQLESKGVNHVVLNLKYGSSPASEVIEEVGEGVLPHFHTK